MKVKFKINLFNLLDDLGGWEYLDEIVENKTDNEYMSEGGYILFSPLENDELEWGTTIVKTEDLPVPKMDKTEVIKLMRLNGVPSELSEDIYDDVFDIIEYYHYEDDGMYESFSEESVESTLSERTEYKKHDIDWKYIHGLVEPLFQESLKEK